MQSTLRKTKLDGWYEYYRETCPVCQKSGGCMINEKGDTVVCIREESNIVFSRNMQSWVHRLKETKHVDTKGIRKAAQTNKKNEPTLLDFVYRALLDVTDLSFAHHAHLSSEKRGMTTNEIAIRGYRSFPSKPWETVKKITAQTGYRQFPGFPGFYKNDLGWSIAGSPGILIPYRNQRNEIVGFQIRIDKPKNDVEINKGDIQELNARVKQPNIVQAYIDGEIIFEREMVIGETEEVVLAPTPSSTELPGWLEPVTRKGTVKLVKGKRYFWLSSSNRQNGTGAGDPSLVHVSVPSHQLKNWESGTLLQTDKVWFTEGALKGDIAVEHIERVYTPEELTKVGSTFISVPGINTWRLALPILEEMGVKHVNIAIDMDMMTNASVAGYMKDLAIELKSKGYTVNVAMWNDEDGKGIDDVLINRRAPQLRAL